MSDQELKPCPFCGSELATNEGSYPPPPGRYYLSCMNHGCGYEGPVMGTLDEAIAATQYRDVSCMGEIPTINGAAMTPTMEEVAGWLRHAGLMESALSKTVDGSGYAQKLWEDRAAQVEAMGLRPTSEAKLSIEYRCLLCNGITVVTGY